MRAALRAHGDVSPPLSVGVQSAPHARHQQSDPPQPARGAAAARAVAAAVVARLAAAPGGHERRAPHSAGVIARERRGGRRAAASRRRRPPRRRLVQRVQGHVLLGACGARRARRRPAGRRPRVCARRIGDAPPSRRQRSGTPFSKRAAARAARELRDGGDDDQRALCSAAKTPGSRPRRRRRRWLLSSRRRRLPTSVAHQGVERDQPERPAHAERARAQKHTDAGGESIPLVAAQGRGARRVTDAAPPARCTGKRRGVRRRRRPRRREARVVDETDAAAITMRGSGAQSGRRRTGPPTLEFAGRRAAKFHARDCTSPRGRPPTSKRRGDAPASCWNAYAGHAEPPRRRREIGASSQPAA